MKEVDIILKDLEMLKGTLHPSWYQDIDNARETINELQEKIEKLQEHNLNGGWHVVSDGDLPNDRSVMQVTAYWHETYQVMSGMYWKEDNVWWCVPFNNCGEQMQKLNVIAWRPLPKPYKKEV